MLRLRLIGLIVLGLVAAGCSSSSPAAHPPNPSHPTRPTASAQTSAPTSTPTSHAGCGEVSFDDVRGPRPAYVGPPLFSYPARRAVCAAYWLAGAGPEFVPQSLEIDGSTAYVAGYRWRPTFGHRPCQLAVVDTRTGEVTAFVKGWQARVYGPRETFCRHGGGMEMTPAGLLVEETQRLWLLDPARLGKGDPVLRVWRLPRSMRGSTLVVSGGRIGIGAYRAGRPGTVWWFRLADVMAPGVSVLDSPVRQTSAPSDLQGMGAGPGGVWSSSSHSRCGVLRGPGHRPVTFVPGAEDVEFRGPDLWVVSEASAKPFLAPGERPVPFLLRLRTAQVFSGPRGRCT